MSDAKICLKITVKGNEITSELDGFYNDENGDPLLKGYWLKDAFDAPDPSDDDIIDRMWFQMHGNYISDFKKIIAENKSPEVTESVKRWLSELESLSLDDIETSVERL